MANTETLLITQYAPLARKLALQLLARLPASVELDDLVQAGMIGLLDAVRRYREAQFQTYATTRIRGAMLDELRSQDWLPRSVRLKFRRIEQAVQKLEQTLGRAPGEAEIAAELELSVAEYQALLYDAQGVQIMHYEDFGAPDEDSDWSARLAASNSHDDPLAQLLSQGLRAAIVAAIDELPEREKLLLSLCYEQGLNLKEIGAVMGVSEGRVCQLRSQATARIRARLHEQDWAQSSEELELLLEV